MAEFGCIRPFGIDDGQLDGLTLQEAFVLGYELAQVDAKIAAGEDFEMPLVHIENRERIESQLWKVGAELLHLGGKSLRWSWRGHHNDQSESWLSLSVRRDT